MFSRLTRACGQRAGGGFALRRAGKDLGSGRHIKGKQQPRQGIARHEGKAAPTRATLDKFNRGFGRSPRFDAEKSLDRENKRNDFCVLGFFRFGRSEIFENRA
ncbi:MAG: hypothetical protein WB764_14180 [Xanthobacteraceae bacterium]